jgi:hypothetical protein
MADVFISYSHKDSNYAYKIADELARYHIEAWIDGRIDYGTQWPRVIENNLDDCPVFIILLSTNSKNSDWVLNELIYAQGKKKMIVPLLLEGENWLSLAATQYVDVRDYALSPFKYFETIQNHLRELAEERDLLKQIILKLSDAVKKKEKKEWEIGVFKIRYGFGPDELIWKNPHFSGAVGNNDLLCYYDLDYKTWRESATKYHGGLQMSSLAILHLRTTNILTREYDTEPTNLEIREYAVRVIQSHKDHHVPISKINIKVVK